MPSPSPEMDPYLENPGLWPDVHHGLTSESQALLGSQLRPKYLVRVEERAYIDDVSDDAFRPQLWIPDIEVLGRPGGEEAGFVEDTASRLEAAEPIIATTWFEEEISIPLKPGDPDARLDLQAVLNAAYDRANYDLEIDYRKEPKPPLDDKLAAWADQLLRSKGLR